MVAVIGTLYLLFLQKVYKLKRKYMFSVSQSTNEGLFNVVMDFVAVTQNASLTMKGGKQLSSLFRLALPMKHCRVEVQTNYVWP